MLSIVLRMYGLLLIVGAFIVLAEADRMHNKIYYNLQKRQACFRRFNGTHQIGCASSRGGNVGVLHYIESREDIEWLIDHGPHKPYIALMTPEMFIEPNVQDLRGSKKINGILVIHVNTTTDRPDDFSPDQHCPTDRYNLYDQTNDTSYAHCSKLSWNHEGNSLFFSDIELPIMALLDEEEVQNIITDCYRKFNEPTDGKARSYPLCSAHMKDAMNGAKDSETCIRRSNMAVNLNPQTYCDPLGDRNIYSLIHAINSSEQLDNKSVIIAAARTDSFSLFELLYPGADAVVTGLVTLLAAAEALGKVKTELHVDSQNKKHIMFTLFAGEAFDYIGSGRMVYEMEQMHFPTKLNDGEIGPHPIGLQHIAGFVEVNQVGIQHGQDSELWIHTDPFSMENPRVKNQTEKLASVVKSAAEGVNLKLHDTKESQALPPASLQSFLKVESIPGIVITDHEDKYTNRYYNSRFDLQDEIGVDYEDLNETERYDYVTAGAAHLTKVATALARGLYQLSTDNNDTGHIEADNTTVANLLYCFLTDGQCELFKSVLKNSSAKSLPKDGIPMYIGVASYSRREWSGLMAEALFSLYLGDDVDNSTVCEGDNKCKDIEDKCQKGMQKKDPLHTYKWMQGFENVTSRVRTGRCVRSTANETHAISPVFDSKEYSTKNYDWKSTKFSTWTESSWDGDAMLLRVFLVPDKDKEIATLCSGIGLLVLSLGAVYIINKRASLLFSLD